jgi:cell division protein FtsB
MGKRQAIVKALLVLVAGYFVWVLASSLVHLYQAQGRLAEAKDEYERAKKEQEELGKQWEEVNGEGFKEREVRDKLNMQLPGETVVIVPEIDLGEETEGRQEQDQTIANWMKWWQLFFAQR